MTERTEDSAAENDGGKTKALIRIEKCTVCDGHGKIDDGTTCRYCRGVGEFVYTPLLPQLGDKR